jgi:hypothetical protein
VYVKLGLARSSGVYALTVAYGVNFGMCTGSLCHLLHSGESSTSKCERWEEKGRAGRKSTHMT